MRDPIRAEVVEDRDGTWLKLIHNENHSISYQMHHPIEDALTIVQVLQDFLDKELTG